MLLLSPAGYFQNIFFPTNSFRVSKSLDPEQDWHSVGPDLGQNCLVISRYSLASLSKQLFHPLYLNGFSHAYLIH